MEKIVLLTETHIRKDFKSTHQVFANYLINNVTQDIKRNVASCYVIANEDDNVVAYYTLSNDSVPKELVPEWADKIRYNRLPVTLLGRLAAHKDYEGQGLGRYLLSDALLRCAEKSSSIASVAVVTDPFDDDAAGFYKKFGFEQMPGGRIIIPMKTIISIFNK